MAYFHNLQSLFSEAHSQHELYLCVWSPSAAADHPGTEPTHLVKGLRQRSPEFSQPPCETGEKESLHFTDRLPAQSHISF